MQEFRRKEAAIMWIVSEQYGLNNTDFMERIYLETPSYNLYGVFSDGKRVQIGDGYLHFRKIKYVLEHNKTFTELI